MCPRALLEALPWDEREVSGKEGVSLAGGRPPGRLGGHVASMPTHLSKIHRPKNALYVQNGTGLSITSIVEAFRTQQQAFPPTSPG